MARPVFSKAFAVGVLVAVAGVAFLVAFTFFRKGGYSDSDSYRVFANFEDATGLTWKSRVQIAGIQVGEVDKIILEGHHARLELRILKNIDVRRDACLTKRFPSTLLPDALLDLAPGSAKAPSLQTFPMEDRGIVCVNEGTSIQKLLDAMSQIAVDVQGVTRNLSGIVSGSEGSIQQIITNLERTSRAINEGVDQGQLKVQQILDNTRALTGTLADVVGKDRESYHAIAANVASATERLDTILKGVQAMMGDEASGGLKASLADARQSLKKLNDTMGEVQKIATKVGEGKSIAGKLLTDERLGQKLGDTVESLTDYVDRLSKLKVQVRLRSEWLYNQKGAKTYAGFALIPRPDQYYLFQIVNDPRGVASQSVQELYTETPTGAVKTTTTTVGTDQRVSFTAELAKRYGSATFRVGLIENTGGAGADLHLLDDALTISLDLYQFWRPGPDAPNLPRAKLWVDYNFLKYFYVTAGTDDFLVPWRVVRLPGGAKYTVGQDVFFGGGITFTDDDLKSIFSSAGSAVSAGGGGAGR